jgi:hypothetical protein
MASSSGGRCYQMYSRGLQNSLMMEPYTALQSFAEEIGVVLWEDRRS